MFKNERLRESSRMIVMMKERKDVSKMFGRNMYAKKETCEKKRTTCRESVSRVYRDCIESVSRVYRECIESVLRVYRECIESVSRVY